MSLNIRVESKLRKLLKLMCSGSFETRSFPNSLAASLSVLPSMSLFPSAPFGLSACPSMSLAAPRLHSQGGWSGGGGEKKRLKPKNMKQKKRREKKKFRPVTEKNGKR